MTAQDLYDFLRDLQRDGVALHRVDVNFRHDFDSDVTPVRGVLPDLYDAHTNTRLESIVIYAEDEEHDLDAPHLISEDFAV
jgi:hypothetical protein